MQQVHGFDELRYDKGVIRNRTAEIKQRKYRHIILHHIAVSDFFD
jgi:hypothetical protein